MLHKIARLVFAVALFLMPPFAAAHCDSVAGPVVTDARLALKSGDVTPVLKWVAPSSEAELRSAFERALAVRNAGAQARELGETYFFETAVRLHRATEGAPYTGLKSEEAAHDPTIEAVDHALATGNSDTLVDSILAEVRSQLTMRFNEAKTRKALSGKSVGQGREYVKAYIELMHYTEGLAGSAHEEAAIANAHAEHK